MIDIFTELSDWILATISTFLMSEPIIYFVVLLFIVFIFKFILVLFNRKGL